VAHLQHAIQQSVCSSFTIRLLPGYIGSEQ